MPRGRKKETSNNYKLPNGFGGVRKLSGNRRKPYCATKTVSLSFDEATGKVKQKRVVVGCYATREDAIAALVEYNKRPFDIVMSKQTFEQVYNKWLNDKKEDVAPKTLASYSAAYSHCKILYNQPFTDLTSGQLQDVINDISSGYSTKKNVRTLFHQLYSYAIKYNFAQNNINLADHLSIGKEQKVLQRIVFSSQEVNTLWQNVDRMPYIDTILILLYTGMRVMELLEMPIANVDLQEHSMYIAKAKNKSSIRKVPIHDRIFPLIKKYYDASVESGATALITNANNDFFTYTNYRQRKFAGILEQLELQAHTPHDTRHTFASAADDCNLNKLCIKRIMGHESPDITDRVYTHKDFQTLLKEVNKISFD